MGVLRLLFGFESLKSLKVRKKKLRMLVEMLKRKKVL
jgi:hypothetical protein